MAKNNANEIRISRLLDAPVEVVWDAWTDPEKTARWWGPRGFTLTHHSKDLRPGGSWVYTMHGPDGTDYPNKTTYFEVEKYARLVYDHGANDEQGPLFRVTVDFQRKGEQTQMEMTMTLPTEEAAREARAFIKKANGDSTWDRLAEFLAFEREQKEIFVINRTFETDIETMFAMWTKPEHLTKWSGPTSSSLQYIEADIRPGGSAFYRMTMGDLTMYGKVRYEDWEKPHRLVYVQNFCDEQGGPARHPLAPTWPEFMRTTVVFTAEGPEETRVTLHWSIHGQATREEIQTFIDGRAGMMGGWTGSFDRLEGVLGERLPAGRV
ncbi:MAG: SRPBCC domain-containing protein [Spirochaetales bacterium]|nr:SRPBCC domain-containing protein [Spirochaetales bacterium]